LAKKGITVWLFSTLTFAAILHLIDATYTLVLNNQIKLLPLYPFIGEELQTITPIIYFLGSTITALTLWGITCAIAFENPVETFLNKILSDAKKQYCQISKFCPYCGENTKLIPETLIKLKDYR